MLPPLNPGACTHGRNVPAPAEVMPFAIGQRFFGYEAHTMEVFRATPGLLRELAASPAEVLGTRRAPVFNPPKADGWPACMSLILNLTHACNLACRYCFVRDRNAGTDSMPYDMAEAAVRALYPDPEAPAHIGFFGGEPLCAWPVLRRVVEWAQKSYKDVRFSVTTNGTLLGQEQADFFAARRERFSFIVSLDGSRARHDQGRPFADGSGSFDEAMAGLKRLAAGGFRPTLRSTFTADGLDLVGELTALNALCDEGLGGHVSIEPVSLTEGCAFSRFAIKPAVLREMEPQYLAAADWFVSRAREGKRARFHHLGKMLERLIQKRPQCSECGAGKAYLTVSPSGEIHACHREKSLIGKFVPCSDRLSSLSIEWLPARKAWRDNRLDVRRGCPSCPLRWLCGGGCRQDSLDEHGDVRIPDPLGCELTRLRFKMAVKVLDAIGPELAGRTIGICAKKEAK